MLVIEAHSVVSHWSDVLSGRPCDMIQGRGHGEKVLEVIEIQVIVFLVASQKVQYFALFSM